MNYGTELLEERKRCVVTQEMDYVSCEEAAFGLHKSELSIDGLVAMAAEWRCREKSTWMVIKGEPYCPINCTIPIRSKPKCISEKDYLCWINIDMNPMFPTLQFPSVPIFNNLLDTKVQSFLVRERKMSRRKEVFCFSRTKPSMACVI